MLFTGIFEVKIMRLGQLARKLALRPTEIVEFLAKKSIHIEEGSNTRMEDDHVSLIMKQFAPERMEEMTAELAAEKEKPAPEMPTRVEQPVAEPMNAALPLPTEAVNEQPIELIKAPKIELTGLKVLGKIELPEPKKKEIQVSKEEDQTEKAQAPEERPQPERRRPIQPRKERTNVQPRINPIALQRERAALEAEKKRKAQAEREKEKRTQNYLKKIKTPAPTKSVSLVKEQVEVMVQEEKRTPPKTWFGRFMRWMNT